MKLQNMVIVFLIIIIPIMLVFSVYFNGEVKTLKLQREYDEALKNATYDAVMSFEENSMNEALSGNAESKRENIKAAISMYIKSLATSRGLSAFNENDIKDYIPALVFGLYDGFYMYTPTLNESGSYEHMLKNYVYYSEQITGTDITIRYSLDNYVAVAGTINGEYITKSGYLVTSTHNYENEENLYENIIIEKPIKSSVGEITNIRYEYYLIPCKYKYNENKVKIYKRKGNAKKLTIENNKVKWGNESGGTGELTDEESDAIMKLGDWWYTYSDFEVIPTDTHTEDTDTSAKNYYLEARNFTEWWNTNIKGLNAAFTIDDSSNNPEDPNSAFSNHKNEIIKNKIQSNLDTAITAYANRQAISSKKFKMPTILEEDWQKIYSNVSVITFLQGIDIGFSEYNSYCVLNSTNHTEYPNPNSLYFIAGNNCDSEGTYHDVRHDSSGTGYRANEFTGTRIITQPISNYKNDLNEINYDKNYWMYYYKHLALGCYDCINNAFNYENEIYDYVVGNEKYWTALARERYITPKSTDNFNSGAALEIDYTLTAGGATISAGQWTNQDVTLTVNPIYKDLNDIKVYIDDAELKTKTYTTEGQKATIKIIGIDNFRKEVEVTQEVNIPIDRTSPSLTLSAKKMDNSEYNSGNLTNQDITLTVNANDAYSGIKEYKFGSEDWSSVNDKNYNYSINDTITVYVKDYANNISSKEFSINIDKEPPNLSVRTSINENYTAINVEIEASEKVRPIANWNLGHDDKKLTRTYINDLEGEQIIEVYDLAGNKTEARYTVHGIDTIKPVIISVNYSNNYVTLNVEDEGGSGVNRDKVLIRKQGTESWGEYKLNSLNKIEVSSLEEARYDICIEDNAGNRSDLKIFTIANRIQDVNVGVKLVEATQEKPTFWWFVKGDFNLKFKIKVNGAYNKYYYNYDYNGLQQGYINNNGEIEIAYNTEFKYSSDKVVKLALNLYGVNSDGSMSASYIYVHIGLLFDGKVETYSNMHIYKLNNSGDIIDSHFALDVSMTEWVDKYMDFYAAKTATKGAYTYVKEWLDIK